MIISYLITESLSYAYGTLLILIIIMNLWAEQNKDYCLYLKYQCLQASDVKWLNQDRPHN